MNGIMGELQSLAIALWDQAKESDFFIVVLGSVAGAFGGALGAQRIAERSKGRDELLKEIRNTNAAIMISFSICNSLLGLKKQHVRALKENYEAQRRDFDQIAEARRQGRGGEFYLNADFRTLSLPSLPVDVLQDHVFGRLSISGRSLVLTTTLRQTIQSLAASLESRNQFIQVLKENPPDTDRLIILYFGLPSGNRVNADYPAFIDAIYAQTDDGIYFSKLLCEDLTGYGESLAKSFRKRFGKGAPNVNKPVWKNAGDLMPPDESYADWVSMFQKMPSRPNAAWWAFWRRRR